MSIIVNNDHMNGCCIDPGRRRIVIRLIPFNNRVDGCCALLNREVLTSDTKSLDHQGHSYINCSITIFVHMSHWTCFTVHFSYLFISFTSFISCTFKNSDDMFFHVVEIRESNLVRLQHEYTNK